LNIEKTDVEKGIIQPDPMWLNEIEFIMVQRSCSLGLLEFMRGRYKLDDYHQIISLFQQMTQDEIDLISTGDFHKIWISLWGKPCPEKAYYGEYLASLEKFSKLNNKQESEDHLALDFYTKNIQPSYVEKEWGFPKGRRNFNEKDLDCSIREFMEETGYTRDQFTVLENQAFQELFFGTNGVHYLHKYHVAIINDPYPIPIKRDTHEIGDIKWLTYINAINTIRDYHTEKRQVLDDVFRFLIGKIDPVIFESNIETNV
jgi:8-oxo-dGTP pyrophosphatase MutT (NUDIX family)